MIQIVQKSHGLDPSQTGGEVGLEYRVHSERRQRQGVRLKKLNNRVVCLISARHCTSNCKSVLFDLSNTAEIQLVPFCR